MPRSSDIAAPAAAGTESVQAARTLAARLPDLLVSARRVAANVMAGVHGRRRPGPGETFWQFRPYSFGEPAKRIDWRRSARDHHLFVREREWEAAQTIWLWTDLSSSMGFRSHLAEVSKGERALLLMLALADMLGRGGERVGVPGLGIARIGRNAAERIAGALHATTPSQWAPPPERIGRHSEVVVLSDCLDRTDAVVDFIRALASAGARLHLVQVLDPAEEAFPYDGRTEFRDPESGEVWIAERADSLKERYHARLTAHRETIAAACQRAGASFSVHHTDRPASEALLWLRGRLADDLADGRTAA